LTIDEFRRGVVRVCDGEGSTRGTGFFVSQSGHVLTCDHVVEGAPQLSVTMADGRNVPAKLAPEFSLPELDFAVLSTDVAPDFVVPIEFAGAVGDAVWASGFQMQGQVNDALPTLGKIAGQTGLEYSFGDRVYKLREILRLEDALVEPGISGGCAALQSDIVAIGAVNAKLKDKGGFILPFRSIQDKTCGLYKLLQQNRQSIARCGKYVNWPAIRELCQKSSNQTLANLKTKGRYSTDLFVKRDAVDFVLNRFLLGNSRILAIVGQTGTGKTNCAAYVTETLSADFTTLLLLAYRLSPQVDGLAASVAANLSKADPTIPALASADVKRAIAEGPNRDLIIILDGLNELPGTIKAAAGEWIESTCEWLQANVGARLIVTCRPEYWNSAKKQFAADLLYTEQPAASDDEPQSGLRVGEQAFQLGDFTEEEAEEASRRYGFPMKEGANIFRHPLLYNIARKALAGGRTAMPSADRLFRDYIDAAVNEICIKTEPQVAFIIRTTLESLAGTLRVNKSLWIDRVRFLDAFSADKSIAGALLGEHLLVEGEGGVRFAFDETAYYLVSQAASKELEIKTAEEIDWADFQKEDPIGADSMSFFIASLEARGKRGAVAKILNGLASQSHAGNDLEPYFLHTLFLRLLQWLRAPSAYFPAMLAFTESCISQSHGLGRHSLTELIDLSGISAAQQMQLLAIMVRRENDHRNRWKDWENLSESEFWNEGTYRLSITTFRLAVKKVLERDPDTAIAALLEWLKDTTRLESYSHSEATVNDLACGILYHSASHWLDPIVDGLAGNQEVDNAGQLLFRIVRKHPLPMMDVCERWAKSGEFDPILLARVVGLLMSMGPQPELVARLVTIVDTTLQQSVSPDIEAAIAESLAADPSTAPRALDMAEKLMQKNYPVNPWLLSRLIPLDPDRVIVLLDSIIVHSRDLLDRRDSAVTALEELAKLPGRALPLLSMVEGYLATYPELSYHLSMAIEKLFYSTKPGTREGNAVDAWVRTNYLKFARNARKPVIFGVLDRAEKTPHGMPLLRTVIAAETQEGHLTYFLQELPNSRLPMEARLELLTAVAQRIDEKDPRNQSMLSAMIYCKDDAFSRFLAEAVAKDPTRWLPSVVEYSNRVNAGEEPYGAAYEISMREQ
jgi:Trypsin-like peptidase domain